MDAHAIFGDSARRKLLMEKFIVHSTQANTLSDTRAFLDFLAGQPDVKPGAIGTTGYCRRGAMSLSAAGTFRERIAAASERHWQSLLGLFQETLR
jgi:carboxymethylenebutenolidase